MSSPRFSSKWLLSAPELLTARLTRWRFWLRLGVGLLLFGLVAEAVTAGKGWFAVVTSDHQILIIGEDGKLKQKLLITP